MSKSVATHVSHAKRVSQALWRWSPTAALPDVDCSIDNPAVIDTPLQRRED
jgi:hypothetical protein